MGSKLSPLICCLDLEGVLTPEVWIKVSEKMKIQALSLTTRDISDYDVLMKKRLGILREHKIRLVDIQRVISKIDPLPGAKKFLDVLRQRTQVVIVSDTYYEFARSLMEKLGQPTLFCNDLIVDDGGFISDYRLRQKNGKEKVVVALKRIGFEIHAAGDSYNDMAMLKAAHRGVLFNPPNNIIKEFPEFKVTKNYKQLLNELLTILR